LLKQNYKTFLVPAKYTILWEPFQSILYFGDPFKVHDQVITLLIIDKLETSIVNVRNSTIFCFCSLIGVRQLRKIEPKCPVCGSKLVKQ
jgi:hypothetical protein